MLLRRLMRYRELHCRKVREILTERNWPEEYLHAVESHGWKPCGDVEPTERIEFIHLNIPTVLIDYSCKEPKGPTNSCLVYYQGHGG
jgi:hypothetical protein